MTHREEFRFGPIQKPPEQPKPRCFRQRFTAGRREKLFQALRGARGKGMKNKRGDFRTVLRNGREQAAITDGFSMGVPANCPEQRPVNRLHPADLSDVLDRFWSVEVMPGKVEAEVGELVFRSEDTGILPCQRGRPRTCPEAVNINAHLAAQQGIVQQVRVQLDNYGSRRVVPEEVRLAASALFEFGPGVGIADIAEFGQQSKRPRCVFGTDKNIQVTKRTLGRAWIDSFRKRRAFQDNQVQVRYGAGREKRGERLPQKRELDKSL